MSWDEKLAQLAHEFPDVEGGKISQILHSTDGDSVQAKALVSIENSSVQQVQLATDLIYFSQSSGIKELYFQKLPTGPGMNRRSCLCRVLFCLAMLRSCRT